MAWTCTLTVVTAAFEGTDEKFYGFRQIDLGTSILPDVLNIPRCTEHTLYHTLYSLSVYPDIIIMSVFLEVSDQISSVE